MNDRERLIKLKNGTVFESEDIDFLLERAELFYLLRDENGLIKQINKRYREELMDIRDISTGAVHEMASKALEVKE